MARNCFFSEWDWFCFSLYSGNTLIATISLSSWFIPHIHCHLLYLWTTMTNIGRVQWPLLIQAGTAMQVSLDTVYSQRINIWVNVWMNKGQWQYKWKHSSLTMTSVLKSVFCSRVDMTHCEYWFLIQTPLSVTEMT